MKIKREDTKVIADKFGLKYQDTIDDRDIDDTLLQRLTLPFTKSNLMVPLKNGSSGKVPVAIGDLTKIYGLNDLEGIFKMPVEAVVSSEGEVLGAINRSFERLSGSAQDVVEEITEESIEGISMKWDEPKDLLDLTDEAPIIKLLNSILFQAVKEKASDIHIEPFERDVEVRLRVDGLLYPLLSPPKVVQEALCSRVKIMANLDIAEKRLPQDGRIRLLVAGKDIDIRVSTVPTAHGERVVLRLLDRKGGLMSLPDIGLSEADIETLKGLLTKSSGIILVTGPTGSGKTTTLYAALSSINSETRNIITIEDPIEYQLKGVGQIAVNSKVGLTFAKGLRSILRQDPDVVMVGEIRDVETAGIAVQASLTGHLVLSTLHTNDAPSAVTRLVDMGVEPYLISSSLTAVMAQRLVRLLCDECKEEYAPAGSEEALYRDAGLPVPEKLWRPGRCKTCFDTGYKGRTSIVEFMVVDQELRSLLLTNPDSTTIREYGREGKVRSLLENGLDKCRAGRTSIEEILRVTDTE